MRKYPAALLKAMKVNERMGSNMDYSALTDDQLAGLEYVLSFLSEREQLIFADYYQRGLSYKEIAAKFEITENRVRQIMNAPLRKRLANPEWLAYITTGYEAKKREVTTQLNAEESRYLSQYELSDPDHIYHKGIDALAFPVRIQNALMRSKIYSIRELLFFVCTEQKIRSIGSIGLLQIMDRLKQEGILPDNFTGDALVSLTCLHKKAEMLVFSYLNMLKDISKKENDQTETK